MGKYLVQNRKDGGKWHTRWALDTEAQAFFYYASLNTFGVWRKRLLAPNGDVVISQYATRN